MRLLLSQQRRYLTAYVQGQSIGKATREYFYFIDHQGQLFLDDARMKNFTSCFKEKSFLAFFFSRLKFNDGPRYCDFPYLSPCGREKNFVRCDDLPIVFTHILENDKHGQVLSYAGAGDKLTVQFEPNKLCMFPDSGRVYHPGPERLGGVGLIKSSLAIELCKHFQFEGDPTQEPPTAIDWQGQIITLQNDAILDALAEENSRKEHLKTNCHNSSDGVV